MSDSDLDRDSSTDCAPPFLKPSEHKLGESLTVTVTGAKRIEYKDEATGEVTPKWAVLVEESPSMVRLSKTAHQDLCRIAGAIPRGWIGKKLTFEVARTPKGNTFELKKVD